MGEQKEFGFAAHDPTARIEPLVVPPQEPREPVNFERYPRDKPIEKGDTVHLVHRTGTVKAVTFCEVAGPRIYVMWPVANEVMPVSIKTGHCFGNHKEWRLEYNAWIAARRVRTLQKRDNRGPIA